MPYLSLIPLDLRALEQRQHFMNWLRAMPIRFHERLRVYFDWLDLNTADYTADEITSLKTSEFKEVATTPV